MKTDIDSYLASNDALRETASAQGGLLHPGETFGGFSVVSFLGRGATSEVWRVKDEALNADFAMKIFAPREASTEKETARLRRRFIAEARCLAQFTHPGIVRIHSLCDEGERPFYTMDLLHPIMRPLPMRKTRKIIDDVLSALDALHAKGVVHRDIKPANVLLDDYGNAILTDFGIVQIDDAETAAQVARSDTATATGTGSTRIAGTPDFSAPEQFMGADATPASDLHAVGRLAIWLFDGKPPLFWRWFVMRATNSSPALRYKSAKAMKRALHAAQLSWLVTCALAATIPIAIAAFLFFHEEPPPIRLDTYDDVGVIKTEWILPGMETPSSNVRTRIITLEGGRSYKIGLLSGWEFYRELKNGKRGGPYRQPLIIQGNGTLYAERITCHHVLLKPGVKLVTSGEYHGCTFSRWNKDTHRHERSEYPPRPPHDANLTNAEQTVYAAYIVEPGAKLVFTDNTDYPESLIERR